ncbi:MAG TPA: RidA family protein [Chloroflexota bacterium]|nr:RidA family protein [Chloroflexota bacterium]
MPLERIQPAGLKNLPLFTHVVKAGNTVYLAGQVALDTDGQVVGRGDITAQAAQVFENLRTALAAVGANFSNLAKITVFATDVSFLRPIAEVRARYLGRPDPVASTFVVVAGLAWPEFLLEIEAIAVLD